MTSTTQLLNQCRNVYAIGRNYRAHAAELNNPVPSQPLLFSKSTASLCTGNRLQLATHLGTIHHELEVVLRVGQAVALGQFDGLACCSHVGLGIDFTARDVQTQLKQKGHPWLRAKSFQAATYISTLQPWDRWTEPLTFQLRRNQKLVQDGDTRHMIFSMSHLLAELNTFLPLMIGDLIFTGTPAGVGPVAPGDTLELLSSELATQTRLELC